jgi:hypothetical protein
LPANLARRLPASAGPSIRFERSALPVTPAPMSLLAAAETLLVHAAGASWRGPDPYDGLWWRWPSWMTAGRRRRQALVQLHARAPVDVRRLYRRRHPRIAKTMALFASAGLRIRRITEAETPLTLALDALETLAADDTAGPRAWGYPFDVQTRWSHYTAGAPNVVVTTFAASALLDGARHTGRDDFAARAREAARWIAEELWVTSGGYFAYHTDSHVNIHNANLLGAATVHEALGDDPAVRDKVARSVKRTLSRQRSDGSWEYGEADDLRWADSFHTGYVLLCLARLRDVDSAVPAAIERAAGHYQGFFDARGRATLWAGREWPEDAHSAGTGLSALAMLLANGHIERALLERVAGRVLEAGLRGPRAVARRHRWGPATVWYPRWCDGHVALGLADAATALAATSPPRDRYRPRDAMR